MHARSIVVTEVRWAQKAELARRRRRATQAGSERRTAAYSRMPASGLEPSSRIRNATGSGVGIESDASRSMSEDAMGAGRVAVVESALGGIV